MWYTLSKLGPTISWLSLREPALTGCLDDARLDGFSVFET